jgi:hypothetical protein
VPRYVILRHTGGPDPDHYDFMLEAGDALKTWTVHSLDWTTPQSAAQNRDHRLAYLQYEGPIAGNRGEVRRVAAGEYEAVLWGPDRISVRFDDGRSLSLVRIDGTRWTIGPV